MHTGTPVKHLQQSVHVRKIINNHVQRQKNKHHGDATLCRICRFVICDFIFTEWHCDVSISAAWNHENRSVNVLLFAFASFQKYGKCSKQLWKVSKKSGPTLALHIF